MWLKHIKFSVISLMLVFTCLSTVPLSLLTRTPMSEYVREVKELFAHFYRNVYFGEE